MKLRINYSDGTEKSFNIKDLNIMSIPEEIPNPPFIFHINNSSDTELFIHATSNVISDLSKVKNIDFIE